ncbi:hypothetical protein MD588_01905 [Photobacterium sp. SDRW27]|uniref:VF_A0006 family four-cysteine protein n=1 Tax=Photobacterium obscurum TaxID=2829490 RepID=UPI002242ED8A|nr:VF_A0006 family four-cysteine protein [Photobacterium obscurum]MCW8327556.1 hypothetical protein [Photobacterium obscurum]
MKRKAVGVVGIIILIVSFQQVAKEDKVGYEDCILEHVSGTEDALAANLMTYACHRLYIDNFMLSEKDQAYFQCLLDYMPDAKKPEITLQIKRVCNDKHRSLFW